MKEFILQTENVSYAYEEGDGYEGAGGFGTDECVIYALHSEDMRQGVQEQHLEDEQPADFDYC